MKGSIVVYPDSRGYEFGGARLYDSFPRIKGALARIRRSIYDDHEIHTAFGQP